MSLNYPENVEDQKVFDETVQKIVDSMVRVKAEQELVKTLTGDLKDAYGSDPALVKKEAKLVYQASTEGLMEEVAELVAVFESITNKGEV